MVKQKTPKIIWDRIALDSFKDILEFLSKQSSFLHINIRGRNKNNDKVLNFAIIWSKKT